MRKLRIPTTVLLVCFGLLIPALCGAQSRTQTPVHWKAVLMSASADDGLENWDNARLDLYKQLVEFGVAPGDIAMLSAHDKHIGQTEGGGKVALASTYNLRFAIQDLQLKPGEGLFIFITSHGAQNGGISLGKTNSFLSVFSFNDILKTVPETVPTVMFLSACFSGQFIQGPTDLRAPNRVIFTAARNDRASFGCGAGVRVTNWDGAMLSALTNAGPDSSWSALAQRIASDIDIQEAGYGESGKSYPQSFVGSGVSGLPFFSAPVALGAASQPAASSAGAANPLSVEPAGPRIDAVYNWENKFLYFFEGARYFKWDLNAKALTRTVPRDTAEGWPGLSFDRIDATLDAGEGRVLFFRKGEFVTFDFAQNKVLASGTLAAWKNIPFAAVDAAYNNGDGKAYLIRGNQYVRVSTADWTVDPGYPMALTAYKGLPWQSVDEVFKFGSTLYFFSGNAFVRYDSIAGSVVQETRRTIASGFPGVDFSR